MRIIARKTLALYYRDHADAKDALEEWFEKTERAKWSCFADVKNTFNSVDAIGDQRFVFNIKGNDYRLTAVIKFSIQTVYIRNISTHSQYDKTRLK